MKQWWITDGALPQGRKILGPFATQDVAISARARLERETEPETYWVDSETV